LTLATHEKLDEREFGFSTEDFARVRNLIYQKAGISLSESKSGMVYSRFGRHFRSRGIPSFKQYLDELEDSNDPEQWQFFTNALTTNLTSFFREAHHFPILADHMLQATGPLKIWCSAASTGEEPYSIAMTACEAFGTMNPPVEIVASDIDTNVLEIASRGVYASERINKLSEQQRKQFFLKGSGQYSSSVKVRDELRRLVTFEPLNLLDNNWFHTKVFDAIFCRNVMIYFDRATQSKILSKFIPIMKKDGLLFAGHSENFTFISNAFKLRGKTVYELKDIAQRTSGPNIIGHT
jgi:chemotaxis protein methyltransferase CheR